MVGQVIGAQGMAGLVQHRQLIWMEKVVPPGRVTVSQK